MAGIPLDQFERLFDPRRTTPQILEGPVRYDVWRVYALRGPQLRADLLLARSDLPTALPSSELVRLLQRMVTADEGSSGPDRAEETEGPFAVTVGEWTLVRANLPDMIRRVLPFTVWRPQLKELTDAGTDLSSYLHPEARPDPKQVIQRWLARTIARILGWDPDYDSLGGASVSLAELLANPPWAHLDYFSRAEEEACDISSISIDRPTFPASVVSTTVVKADAAHTLFKIDCSSLVWAVVDSGIDGGHPAFMEDSPEGTKSRVEATFDLTRLDWQDLATSEGEPDPNEALEKLVFRTNIGLPGSPNYRKPEHSAHGTHVAGILAGRGMRHEGIQGMCPDLRLWDFRVLSDEYDEEAGLESRVIMALRYIRNLNERAQKIRVCGVNLSLSIPYDPSNYACGWTPICVEVRRLVRSGVVVVAAAGNAGWQAPASKTQLTTGYMPISITDPGNAEDAITVGATHGSRPFSYGTSYFSGRGPTADGRLKPDLLAPGEAVRSCGLYDQSIVMSGTSQAVPHVSGAAAMLMGRHPELVGQPERVKAILCQATTDLGRSRDFQGSGLLDVLRALQSA